MPSVLLSLWGCARKASHVFQGLVGYDTVAVAGTRAKAQHEEDGIPHECEENNQCRKVHTERITSSKCKLLLQAADAVFGIGGRDAAHAGKRAGCECQTLRRTWG